MLFLPISATPAFLVAKSKETYGSYAPVLLGMVAIAALGGICCLFLRERRGGHVAPREQAQMEQSTVSLL